ncbi:HAD family hydrolase [Cellulomonas soli]|uniref:Haloacid dehalogenase n=1 Tax=Cellulomonas soli TaxID=931535 RepID=A0A512PDR3_9CELL|nr:HAD family hydrolase [Cellulomonas soli]NYI60009.1 putative hydrolase of the HAD superfamily [Cellulomonas soli]GEP69338.1 haloacid dehalogenase [Cellulomonas soli]
MTAPLDPGAGATGHRGVLAGLVDGVLFDVDDTLVTTRDAFARAIDAVAVQYLPHVPPEARPAVLALWREDPDGYYRAYTRGELTFDEQRMRRANQLQARFGGDALDEAGYRAWLSVFWSAFEEGWQGHGDAPGLLDRLEAAGIAVGALSNASTTLQTSKLARADLLRVPMLVGVDTLGFGKPDPRVFLEACRLLGTDPARTVYVGDELDVDARGARDAGLIGAWLDRPGERRGGAHPEDPDDARASGVLVVGSLTDLGDALGV